MGIFQSELYPFWLAEPIVGNVLAKKAVQKKLKKKWSIFWYVCNNEMDLTTPPISECLSVADEKLLLQKISAGDRQAYAILHKKYHVKIYKYIAGFTYQSVVDAEEVVQEIFITIWEKRANLLAIQNFDAYLRRAAKNKLLNILKQDEYKLRLHKNYHSLLATQQSLVEDNVSYKEYYKTALKAIELLPEKRKLVFLLSTQENLSLGEIADKLQVSKSRVKQQLYGATSFIKSYLKKNAAWVLVVLVFLEK